MENVLLAMCDLLMTGDESTTPHPFLYLFRGTSGLTTGLCVLPGSLFIQEGYRFSVTNAMESKLKPSG